MRRGSAVRARKQWGAGASRISRSHLWIASHVMCFFSSQGLKPLFQRVALIPWLWVLCLMLSLNAPLGLLCRK